MSLVEDWPSNLHGRIPCEARNSHSDAEQVTTAIREAQGRISLRRQALLWLSIGEIDKPHEIVQNDSTSLGSYMHGIVHRLEGDYWNSNYWFQRARDRELLSRIERQVDNHVRENGLMTELVEAKILPQEKFDPSQFVQACQHCRGENQILLEQVGFAEWLALWNYVD